MFGQYSVRDMAMPFKSLYPAGGIGCLMEHRMQAKVSTSTHAWGHWQELWHVWFVLMPRRSITGKLVRGKVWRRRDGRRWIYKRFIA
jgi:hypothetical protein